MTLIHPKLVENKCFVTSRGSKTVRYEKLHRVEASKLISQEWNASNFIVSMSIPHLCSVQLWVKFALGANQITLRGTFSTSHFMRLRKTKIHIK